MTARLIDPSFRALDGNGNPISGACLYVYTAGTSTPVNTYSDTTLLSANNNPVESGATGLFPDMFVAAGNYKVIFTDGSGSSVVTDVTLDTWDNIEIAASASFSGGINASGYTEQLVNSQTGTTYTYLTGDRAKMVVHSNIASIAAALPQANSSTFPAGWYMDVVNEGAGVLTITPTTSTIGGETTLVLTRGQAARVTSDGTNYHFKIEGEPVGSEKTWYSSTAPYGWLIQNGDTMGSASSGGTKAAAKYRALYIHLWDAVSDTYAAVSTGRGASANADFDANKTITIPSMANRSAYGVGTAATGETAGATTVTSTGSITINAVTLSEANLPANITMDVATGNVNDGGTTLLARGSAGGVTPTTVAFSSVGSGSSFTPTGTYTGNATSVLHSVRGKYSIIKY